MSSLCEGLDVGRELKKTKRELIGLKQSLGALRKIPVSELSLEDQRSVEESIRRTEHLQCWAFQMKEQLNWASLLE
jgi:hypothetical protein